MTNSFFRKFGFISSTVFLGLLIHPSLPSLSQSSNVEAQLEINNPEILDFDSIDQNTLISNDESTYEKMKRKCNNVDADGQIYFPENETQECIKLYAEVAEVFDSIKENSPYCDSKKTDLQLPQPIRSSTKKPAQTKEEKDAIKDLFKSIRKDCNRVTKGKKPK